MEHWMLIHELNVRRHGELIREAQRARLARRALEGSPRAGARLAMALSVAMLLLMAFVRG